MVVLPDAQGAAMVMMRMAMVMMMMTKKKQLMMMLAMMTMMLCDPGHVSFLGSSRARLQASSASFRSFPGQVVLRGCFVTHLSVEQHLGDLLRFPFSCGEKRGANSPCKASGWDSRL